MSALAGIHSTISALRLPVYDFLAPSVISCRHQARKPIQCVSITTSAAPASTEPEPESIKSESSAKRRRSLSKEQQQFLDSAMDILIDVSLKLRVNQAGELAATLIYTAQTPPIIKVHPHLRPLMKHMYDQEAGHFSTFNALLAKHRIRPTAMYPLWKIAATALGWTTAMMGREAAMACTEAVETEIGGHYNGQVRVLLEWMKSMEERGEEVGEEVRELVKTVKRIRDEELEHLDHATEHDAKLAQGHGVLTNVIKAGCRGAIWISEKV
ncbi:MAG: hypothetical protein M1827_004210 [Pycnora praestabilis]|nr:MAG: hypothetical protein M1827_004210 [Pycnora praestabilis]